ncbi:MAG: molybdenum cofactor biosynthesis protein MoaE [Dehalococcoidia bacterium]|nr:molybdenum cofactor biosynthesis protein MoaE [Dehalococcoidia bacterium]MDZ4247326.1 molybdenum cofactor biosynthesis protein MoaE [Dehalococcoidia bacterium]
MIEVTEKPLDPESITAGVKQDNHGAVVTFLGTVRDNSMGKKVLHLQYEAYKEMAEKKLQEIAGEIEERWGLGYVSIYHRTGQMGVGEISLVVAVGSPHRAEAFAACQYAVDRIKQIVPIWKKETFVDGESWVEGEKPA